MSLDNLKSALYGEFDKQNKPILDGFIKNFNLTLRWFEKLLTKKKEVSIPPKHKCVGYP
jgi:hypothetical protein